MVLNAHRTYVIGDIHGHLDLLNALLDRLPLKDGDTLIFVGDYIDRGDNSKAVVDRLIKLKKDKRYTTAFLMGNHEQMFIEFLANKQILDGLPPAYLASRTPAETRAIIGAFLTPYNGTGATLRSYGYSFGTYPDRIRLPKAHIEFYRDLKLSHQVGDTLIVHAGVDILRDGLTARTVDEVLKATPVDDLLWSRKMVQGESLTPQWEFRVICGHTPQKGRPLVGEKFVCIDLGAAWNWELAALCLEENIVYLSGGRSFSL